MKATELMVGDWVYCEGQPTPENVTIQTIAEDGVWFNGPNYEGAASYDRIFPIPLTPEILEKNGFDNQGYFGECILGDWRILCDTKNVAIFHREHCNMDTPIEYVHELQHALKLCRIDKEIKL